MDTLYSVDEAARRLGGVSKWTVHAWLSQGKLVRTKVGGRTMIRESELQKMIQDGGKSPAPARKVRGTEGLSGTGNAGSVMAPVQQPAVGNPHKRGKSPANGRAGTSR